jgi:hypothetical protein
MILRSSIVAIASCVSCFLLMTGTAGATITLPDSGSHATSGTDWSITNTGTGTGIGVTASSQGIGINTSGGIGIISFGGDYGVEASGDIAVAGDGDSIGVSGQSSSGFGVYGSGDTGNGVVGQNNNQDYSAAAISALSGNAATGLAYWGTGGMELTGDLYIGGTPSRPGGGMWISSSDARIKRDVKTLACGLEELRQIRPVTYNYNGLGGMADDGHQYVGVIAQELEKVIPSMVTTRKAKLHPSDTEDTDIKVVDPSAFTYLLINAVKEQQETIDRQEHRIASLERRRTASLSSSLLGGGFGTGLALGLLPLSLLSLRRRKESKSA